MKEETAPMQTTDLVTSALHEIERQAAEIERLQTAINEAYRIMCSGTPPHSARETNARRVLRLAGVAVKEQSV